LLGTTEIAKRVDQATWLKVELGRGKEFSLADHDRNKKSNVELRGAEQASLAERPSRTQGWGLRHP